MSDAGLTASGDARWALSGVLDAIGVNAPPGASERVGIVFPMF